MTQAYRRFRLGRRGLWGLGICIVLAVLVAVLLHPARRQQMAVPPEPTVSPVSSPSTSAPAGEASPMQFSDVTAGAGIAFTHFAGVTGEKWYPETIGSGVGFFDYDGDGWVDLLFVNGSHLNAEQAASAADPGPTMQLYRNRGDGTFEDVTRAAGLAVPVYGMGMAAADYDNDGDSDVLVTGYQRHVFFVNNGNGTFTDATDQVGIQGATWGSGAAFFDYDRDGLLDLALSSYVEWQPELEAGLDCTYGTPSKDYCPVRYFEGQGLRLYRNRGDGTFADVTQHAGVSAAGSRAFAPYIFDYNDDLWPDIFVASDGTPSLLYHNRGDGTFEEVGMRTGIVIDDGGGAYAGMGIDATYPKNDGQLCIAIGNFVGEPTTLHCRARQGTTYHPELYTEVSAWAGIGHATLPYVTFGLMFFDVDLDGYEDLFMANGHVIDEARLRNVPRAQRPQLFRNLGTGKFEEIRPAPGTALSQALVARGAAYADYDQDGDLDIAVSQNQGPGLLLRNDTPRQAHFLRVHLQGTRSNRDGIGAVVRVHVGDRVLRHMLRSGRSYYSQHEMALTFGLGAAELAERVDITWPSGQVDVHTNVEADTELRAIEGAAPEAAPSPAPRVAAGPVATAPQSSPTEPLDASTNQAFMAQTRAGVDAYQAGQHATAIEAFEMARQLRPAEPLTYRYLAELYWQQGKHDQAADIVRSLATVYPDAYFLDRLGGDHEAADRPDLALLFYQQAVRLDPRFPSARYNLGRSYLNRGDMAGGMREIQEALRLYPEFADGHLTLGIAYTQQNRFDLAIRHLKRALAIQPDLAAARNQLARIYTAQGDLAAATQTYRELVRYHPEVAEARHNLGVALARQGQQAEAIAEFRQAIRLRPDLHAARIDLATLFLEQQRPQDAIDTLQALIASQPRATDGPVNTVHPEEVHYRLGVAFLMSGQVDKAIHELETTIQKQPEHAAAHMYLGRLYFELGQFNRAWPHARQAEALGAPVTALIDALSRLSAEP